MSRPFSGNGYTQTREKGFGMLFCFEPPTKRIETQITHLLIHQSTVPFNSNCGPSGIGAQPKVLYLMVSSPDLMLIDGPDWILAKSLWERRANVTLSNNSAEAID